MEISCSQSEELAGREGEEGKRRVLIAWRQDKIKGEKKKTRRLGRRNVAECRLHPKAMC